MLMNVSEAFNIIIQHWRDKSILLIQIQNLTAGCPNQSRNGDTAQLACTTAEFEYWGTSTTRIVYLVEHDIWNARLYKDRCDIVCAPDGSNSDPLCILEMLYCNSASRDAHVPDSLAWFPLGTEKTNCFAVRFLCSSVTNAVLQKIY